ncbi:MAG TPA: LytR C-terminal domain-containing protein [Gemmatimonadaceae bacterium]|nr:LytR C-terminal domain-containing protein [Gemmatimonadaceae bacterium]
MKRWHLWLLASLFLAGGAVTVVRLSGRNASHISARPPAPGRADARAPADVRIRVEVLNATRTQGLARRATFYLRDRGFDVVASGNAREIRDSTLIIDRTRHPAWATLVANAMDGAPVLSRPDSSHYLDVSVLIGRDWRPPAEPFYP